MRKDIDLPKCIKFAKNIENGKFSENTEKVKDLVKLPTWQVRDEEYIPKSLKYIKSKNIKFVMFTGWDIFTIGDDILSEQKIKTYQNEKKRNRARNIES